MYEDLEHICIHGLHQTVLGGTLEWDIFCRRFSVCWLVLGRFCSKSLGHKWIYRYLNAQPLLMEEILHLACMKPYKFISTGARFSHQYYDLRSRPGTWIARKGSGKSGTMALLVHQLAEAGLHLMWVDRLWFHPRTFFFIPFCLVARRL